MLNLIIGIL